MISCPTTWWWKNKTLAFITHCYFGALNTTHMCNHYKQAVTMATITAWHKVSGHSRWGSDRSILLGCSVLNPYKLFYFSLKRVNEKYLQYISLLLKRWRYLFDIIFLEIFFPSLLTKWTTIRKSNRGADEPLCHLSAEKTPVAKLQTDGKQINCEKLQQPSKTVRTK